MNSILFYFQIVVSIVLIILIAIQQRGTALGGAFGGSGEVYFQKRGLEKKIYYLTIITSALFLALGIANLLL